MGANSAIEWTEHTWNPWRGCTKVSAGCKNCYAFDWSKRAGFDPEKVVRTADSTWKQLLNKRKYKSGDRVFVCSVSDFLHEDAIGWCLEAWKYMRARPDLFFIICTKRIERWSMYAPDDWEEGWPNVMLMVTAEDKETTRTRVPALLKTPARWRGASLEPLLEMPTISYLGPLCVGVEKEWDVGDMTSRKVFKRLDLIIVGGESGAKARCCLTPWIVRQIRDACAEFRIRFFFKQWGQAMPTCEYWHPSEVPAGLLMQEPGKHQQLCGLDRYGALLTPATAIEYLNYPIVSMVRAPKETTGCTLDGREHKSFPIIPAECFREPPK